MTGAEIVDLTWPEMGLTWYVAGQRNLTNKLQNVAPRYGAAHDDEMSHVAACRGELAVAKAYNLFWSGSVGNKEAVDVGDILEVRSSARTNARLILHPKDKDDFPFVLVDVSTAPIIHLRGWIMGRDGKQRKYWTDPAGGRPAYFISESHLLPMADLRPIVEVRRAEIIAKKDEAAA